jgi:hypothetical protein
MKYEDRLSDLIVSARNIKISGGDREGICAFCGRESNELYYLELSRTFTSSEYLHNTEYICWKCRHMYKTQKYRYHNWVVSKNSFFEGKRYEILPYLIESNIDPPFAVYTTTTYKKQGWIQGMNLLNYGKKYMTIMWDLKRIDVEMKWLKDKIKLFLELRDLGLIRREIRKPTIYLRINIKISKMKLHKLLNLENNPKWEWLVTFCPNRDEWKQKNRNIQKKKKIKLDEYI